MKGSFEVYIGAEVDRKSKRECDYCIYKGLSRRWRGARKRYEDERINQNHFIFNSNLSIR